MSINDHIYRVGFSETEREICLRIGELRHQKTSQNRPDSKQDPTLDSLEIVQRGVISEYAACKLFNVNFNMDCTFRLDFGADLILSDGTEVDVKCVTFWGGNLNAVGWSGKKPCDIYLLTELGTNYVNVVGFVSAEDFLKHGRRLPGKNGGKPFISYPRQMLHPVDDYVRKDFPKA